MPPLSCYTLQNIDMRFRECVLVPTSQEWTNRLSTRRSDGGLTMQVSSLKDKPNMRAGTKGDTPEVAGRHLIIILM